jgi:hypothetical protein
MGAALLTLNTAQAQPVPYGVTVRVYNTAGAPRGEVAAAQRVADRIFEGAGIRVRWRECRTVRGPSASAPDGCEDVVQARELIARLVTGGADATGTSFGYALIDANAQSGTLATIFTDRIGAAAARLRVPRGTLIGRTLAHELGHLLLGSNSHGLRGLMRAWWAETDLRRDVERDWRFLDREVAHMNQALAIRAAGEMLSSAAPAARNPL